MSDTPHISPLAPTSSPLAEADPNAINEFIEERVNVLFNKKPPFTDDELRPMIEYYRRERARFAVESAQKPPGRTGAKRKTPTSVAEALASSEDLL
jgi:hypothetical protein